MVKKKNLRKKILCITFSLAFAILTFGTVYVSTTLINNSNIEITNAALTTSQTRTAQTKLKKWGYYKGRVDGIYGSQTRIAVRYFQQKNRLQVDGIIGPKTAAALGMNIKKGVTLTSSNNDLYLLAKCVHAEARGESYVGQVAVAAVILNRVKSASFPNTIAGVIYQPWAFSAVHDGQINLEPNKKAYDAARDALNGWDPTYGSLYYYNAKTATNKWIYGKKTVVTIGNHVFAI